MLYSVKRIMNDTYLRICLDEAVSPRCEFFERKRQFLADLKTKYALIMPSQSCCRNISGFQAILRSGDTLTIFNEIIERRDSLYEKADALSSWKVFTKTEATAEELSDAAEITTVYRQQPAGRFVVCSLWWMPCLLS